jgi:hypothetical protein
VPRSASRRGCPGQHGAAAGGQHQAAAGGQFADHVGFAPAEAGLAFDLEDPRHRRAGAGLDLVVGIDEAHAQPARQHAPDGGLAGAHQADQEDILVFTVRHVFDRSKCKRPG